MKKNPISLLDRVAKILDSRHMTPLDVPLWIFGMFIAVIWSLPFVWMVSTSFKLPEHVMTQNIEWFPRVFTVENYIKIFEYPIMRWGLNSLIQASVSTALCVMSGAMAGYAFARLKFPGNGLIFAIFIASLMIPVEVTVVPLLLAVIKIGWASSYQALILPTIAATVIIFTLNWNNFLWPLLVTFDESMKTMPVGIAAFAPVIGSHTQLEGFSVSMAAVTVLSIPSLMLFFFLQKYFIQGISQGSVKA